MHFSAIYCTCIYLYCLLTMQYYEYQQSRQEPQFEKDPGRYHFSIHISGKLSFLKEVNTFFVQNEADFAVQMDVTYPEALVPPSLCVRVMVCNSDPSHRSEPVVPCSCNVHTASRSECVCVCVSFTS